MKPYVCAGTIVKLANCNEGVVICTDNSCTKAIVFSNNTFLTESISSLKVVSYEEVE